MKSYEIDLAIDEIEKRQDMSNYEKAVEISKIRKNSHTLVSLKDWARKNSYSFGDRNMYRVIRETEKAIYVSNVDGYHIETFWSPKSAVIINKF